MEDRGGGSSDPRRSARLRVAVLAVALVAVGLVSAVTSLAAVPGAPENTAAPSTSGTLVEGELLTATPGTWSEDPTSFAYQWQRCDPGNAGSCADIAGAASPLYVLASGDIGKAVRVEVIATNAVGDSDPASSVLTGAVNAAAAPSNTAPPSTGAAGSPEVDDELTADPGAWDGAPAPDLAYRWLRCTGPAIVNCSPIPQATSRKYTPVAADLGLTLRVEVTAQNASGIASETSEATNPVVASTRPANTTPPVITGAPSVGQTLTTSNGTWAPSQSPPLTFTYQWQRCNEQGDDCVDIGAATHQTYVLQPADAEHRIVAVVTATDQAAKKRSAASSPTDVVGTGPVNTAKPVVSGSVRVGSTLTASAGTWENQGALAFSYQWRRCNAQGQACQNIGGATQQTYRLQSADLGSTIVAVVTAKDAAGKTQSATSSPTATVTGVPPGGTVPVTDVSLPDRLIVSVREFQPAVLRSRAPFTARFLITDTRGHVVSGADVNLIAVPYGRVEPSGTVKTDANGWATFVLQPTSKFPLRRGYLITMQVRASKPGDPLLAGVSARRLVSVRINPY